MAVTIQQLNARLQQQGTAMTILTSEKENLARQVQSLTGAPGQRVRAGEVDTCVIGNTDKFDEDLTKYADWLFKLRSHSGAVDQQHQEELVNTEAASTTRLNASLDGEGSASSTQMYYTLVVTTAGAAMNKRHTAGVNEGFEAWRQAEPTSSSSESMQEQPPTPLLSKKAQCKHTCVLANAPRSRKGPADGIRKTKMGTHLAR